MVENGDNLGYKNPVSPADAELRNAVLERCTYDSASGELRRKPHKGVRGGQRVGCSDGRSLQATITIGNGTGRAIRCQVAHLIWLIHHGARPKRIEHIDGDRMNNRIENLKEWSKKPRKPKPRKPRPRKSEEEKRATKEAAAARRRNRERGERQRDPGRFKAKALRHYNRHKRVKKKPPVYLPEKGIVVHGSGKLKGQQLGGAGKGSPRWKLRWNGSTVSRDRLVWFLETGDWPPERGSGTLIHINGDDLDDRFENLAIRDTSWAWMFNITAEEKAKRRKERDKNPRRRAQILLRSHLNRLQQSVRKGKSFATCERVLGYTADDFIEHIERLWEPGMSWGNYGRRGWTLGHIISVDWYTSNGVFDAHIVHALSNIKPQWANENYSQGPRLHHIGQLFEYARTCKAAE